VAIIHLIYYYYQLLLVTVIFYHMGMVIMNGQHSNWDGMAIAGIFILAPFSTMFLIISSG